MPIARSADLFVAHFIGSPGMNFVVGEMRDGQFVAEGLSLPVETSVRAGPTKLGIRPEFVTVAKEGGLPASVLMDEYLGSCRNVHLQTACGRMVMRVSDETAFVVGTQLALTWPAERALIFDPVSGERL